MTIQEFATAVQTQIAAVSGLSGSKVIWEAPNVPRPARPFISLAIMEDGDEEPLPEESQADNPSPTPGTAGTLSGLSFLGGLTVHATVGGYESNFVFSIVLESNGGGISIQWFPAYDSGPGHPPGWYRVSVGTEFPITFNDLIAGINASFPEVLTVTGPPNPANIMESGGDWLSGGFPSQDPLLLSTTDRPEIVVRVTAFTDAPKTGAISPAFALLKKVRGKMGSELTADALDPITVLDRGNVTNVTIVLETGYEGRAVLDLKFGSIETETEGINTIETVKTHITVKNLDNSVIIDKTVTLPNS